MNNIGEIAAIKETFSEAETPPNVRAAAKFQRRIFLRRFTSIALGSGLFSTEGNFVYRAGGKDRRIKYNARNLQFRALYDPEYYYGYEVETGILMRKLCRGSGAFWDVGANWGYFSLLAASFPEFHGGVLAFEPNMKTYRDLIGTVEQAGMSDRIRALNQGVGSESCDMVVAEVNRFNTGLSHLTNGGDGAKISVITLDSLSSSRPQFIKIDAEGMELEILRGSTSILADARPFVVFENFLESDVVKTYAPLEFLRANDYQIFVPVLRFQLQGRSVAVSYGHDYNVLFSFDSDPTLCLRELKNNERYLLGRQLNLLGVHSERVKELWTSGIQKMDA